MSLKKQLYNTSYIEGKFTLRSGLKTNKGYFDKYLFESNPKLLRETAERISLMLDFPNNIDYIAGLELGGVPIAVMLSQIINLPTIFVRKRAKIYGTAKLAEGPSVKGKTLLIIEDVTTSGGQVVISAQDLRDRGAIINDTISVIDRGQGATKALKDIDITLHPLYSLSELKSVATACLKE